MANFGIAIDNVIYQANLIKPLADKTFNKVS